jgi:hypothetical protein
VWLFGDKHFSFTGQFLQSALFLWDEIKLGDLRRRPDYNYFKTTSLLLLKIFGFQKRLNVTDGCKLQNTTIDEILLSLLYLL